MAKRRAWGSVVQRKNRNGKYLAGYYLKWTETAPDGRARVRMRKAESDDRGDAESELAAIREEVEQVERGDLDIATFADQVYLPLLRSRGRSAAHIGNVACQLQRAAEYFEGVPLRRISVPRLEEFFADLRRKHKLAANTTHRYRAALSGMWKAAIRRGMATTNPARLVELEKPEKKPVPYLDGRERLRLLNACPVEIRPHVRLGLETGCRLGELERLEWRDVRLGERPTLTVRRAKSRKTRTVPLTPGAVELLEKLQRERGAVPIAGPDYVLSRRRGLGRSARERKFKAAAIAAKFPEVTFHWTRHQFASDLVRSGVPAPTVAKILGHQDGGRLVFEVYGHHAPANAEELAMAALAKFRQPKPRRRRKAK